MRKLLFATASIALIASPAFAKPCRDTHGKFIKCATTAPAKSVKCKDAKGKFAKCTAPGAKPIK